jgi:DNA primase
VFALEAAGGSVTFDEVNARLEEADQQLLAEAVLRDDVQPSREEVLAALRSIQRTEQQQTRDQLKTQIREAERTGRLQEALRLTEELQRMGRK